MRNLPRPNRRRFIAAFGLAVLNFALTGFQTYAGPDVPNRGTGAQAGPEPTSASAAPKKRVAVLSAAVEPAANTSQGLYIRILREAGFEARAVSAEEVRDKKLEGFDIFIIGGGNGSTFSKALGAEGGKVVQEFIRKGGGALASCAGGYSFVDGDTAVQKYVTIAKANALDRQNGRWARGEGQVEIAPVDDRYRPLKMFYANGPLWEIAKEQGTDRTVALARFKSDVKKKGDPGGVMPGTPAILGGTYGDGRFVLFSGHPEFFKKLGNNPLVSDAARWVTRGRLESEDPIRWEDVFPSSEKLESATDKPDRNSGGSPGTPK